MRSTSLEDAILTEAELEPGILIGWSISPRDQNFPSLLRDRLVDGMDIHKDETPGSNYARTDLANARLNGANLEGANLSYAVAHDIELRDADFSRTDLRELTKYSDFPRPRDRVANETLVEQPSPCGELSCQTDRSTRSGSKTRRTAEKIGQLIVLLSVSRRRVLDVGFPRRRTSAPVQALRRLTRKLQVRCTQSAPSHYVGGVHGPRRKSRPSHFPIRPRGPMPPSPVTLSSFGRSTT